MTVTLLSKDKKTQLLFTVNLTCEHCREKLHEETIQDIRDLEKGVTCSCSICQAKITVRMEMSQEIEMEEEEDGTAIKG